MIVLKWFLWFVLYGVLGWIYESIVCSVQEKRLVNRGFLNGPLCPIYGFGALSAILALDGISQNIFLLFIGGALLASILEYLAGWLLEVAFHAKWWDYSNYRFNLSGRVCLLGAVVFGALSVLAVRVIHPYVKDMTARLPDNVIIIASVVLLALLLLDFAATLRHLLLLGGRLREIQSSINLFLDSSVKRAEDFASSLHKRFESSEYYTARIKALLEKNNFQDFRLARAFPKLRPIRYEEAWKKIKEALFGDRDR